MEVDLSSSHASTLEEVGRLEEKAKLGIDHCQRLKGDMVPRKPPSLIYSVVLTEGTSS